TSVVVIFWQRYFAKIAAVRDIVPASSSSEKTSFVPGERIMYWSASYSNWFEGVVLAQNIDPTGVIVSYNLDVKVGALPCNIKRAANVVDRSAKVVELIVKYMPLKADRCLPGDLLRTMRECGWIAITQFPYIFRSEWQQPQVYPQPRPSAMQPTAGAQWVVPAALAKGVPQGEGYGFMAERCASRVSM
ncbi:unnamed protein product, partial [Polarella glacialis]